MRIKSKAFYVNYFYQTESNNEKLKIKSEKFYTTNN